MTHQSQLETAWNRNKTPFRANLWSRGGGYSDLSLYYLVYHSVSVSESLLGLSFCFISIKRSLRPELTKYIRQNGSRFAVPKNGIFYANGVTFLALWAISLLDIFPIQETDVFTIEESDRLTLEPSPENGPSNKMHRSRQSFFLIFFGWILAKLRTHNLSLLRKRSTSSDP